MCEIPRAKLIADTNALDDANGEATEFDAVCFEAYVLPSRLCSDIFMCLNLISLCLNAVLVLLIQVSNFYLF